MWYVIIHLTFVLSTLGMAYVDRMNRVSGVKPHWPQARCRSLP